MKPSRWNAFWVTGLIVVFVLGLSVWRWVTWPDQTARRFVALLASGQFDQANEMMPAPMQWQVGTSDAVAFSDGIALLSDSRDGWRSQESALTPQFLARSGWDVLYGRRHFRVEQMRFVFTAEFGRITPRSFAHDGSGGSSTRSADVDFSLPPTQEAPPSKPGASQSKRPATQAATPPE